MRFPRFLWPLVLLGGALVLGAAEPHPSLPPPVIPDCLGVNIHFTDPKPGEMEMLTAAGFKWVRMDLTWAGTERKKGEYDFSAYDRLVAKLDQFKLRAVFILDYGNPLYADPGDRQPFTSRANTPEFREAFARWAVAAVSHFKDRGYLWEMWNEPNGGFWKPKANAQQYIALTKATGEALRAASLLGPKGEAFIGPATSTIDLPFLTDCFLGGLLEFWDGVSVHAYRQNAPETAEVEYRQLRALIRRHAPKDKVIPVISGEWGYSSAWTTQGKDEAARQKQQGENLPRQFLSNIANDVALSIWYDWHDDGPDPKEAEHRFGLVGHEYYAGRDPVYDPKPAYTAMKTLTEQLRGFRFNKTLIGEIVAEHRLLFTRGDDVDMVVWNWPAMDGAKPPALPPGKIRFTESRGKTREPSSTSDAPRSDGTNESLQIAAAWPRWPLDLVVDKTTGATVRQEFKNPLSHPIELQWDDSPSQMVKAGKIVEREFRIEPTREEDFTADVSLAIAGMGRFAQRSHRSSSAPLQLTSWPIVDGSLTVRIVNSYATSFEGQLRVEGLPVGEGAGQASVTLSVPVVFPPWTAIKMVVIPIPQVTSPSYRLKLTLDEGKTSGAITRDTQVRRLNFDLGDSAHPISYEFAADGEAKVAGSATVEPESKQEIPPYVEKRAFTIRYSFGAGWKFLSLIRSEIPWPAIPDQPVSFGLWIYGDARGVQARIRFKDSTGQIFQSDAGKIDWQGWNFAIFPLRPAEGRSLAHWGGANDGVIHYPIRWETPLLLDNISRQPLEGEIVISGPALIY